MIRTGDENRASFQHGREIYISGERVKNVTTHPMFKPLVDKCARIYDRLHEGVTRDVMMYSDEQRDETVSETWSLFDGQGAFLGTAAAAVKP